MSTNVDESYLYQQIAESIRRRIISGDLQPGDQLPPIRTMVKNWNCTPGTVQRAYQELARQGLLSSHPGKGTFVLNALKLPQDAHIRTAALVHRAEAFLLEVFTSGYTIEEVQQAINLAIDHWQILESVSERGDQIEICFSGSHDLAVKWLSEHFSEINPGMALKTEFSGSLGGLLSLALGNADLAGSHLWDPDTDTYNETFIRKIFPGQSMVAINLAYRNLGFIVMPGNPLGITKIEHLTTPGVKFINRQSGSGTRVWLDLQLDKAGISETEIAGYENTRVTHSEIAQEIISGNADVGVGLQGISDAFGLEFVMLTQERYDLVTFASNMQKSPYVRIREALTNPNVRHSISDLGGYVCSDSGQIRTIG